MAGPSPGAALGGGLDGAAGPRGLSLGGANRPFQVCAAPQARAPGPARSAGGARSPPAASPGGGGGAPPSHAPPAQPIGGRARPHVRRAGPGGEQNVNGREERDLKVLAAPAEDKCASSARSQRPAGGNGPRDGQTDAPTAVSRRPGPRTRRARAPTGRRRQRLQRARGARAPSPLRSGTRDLTPRATRNRWVCRGPRTEGQRHLLSGYCSAAARLCSRCPAGFPAAARRRDFSPLAGLSRARL